MEAVSAFHFEPSTPWDWTLPGLLYERVKGRYPKKEEQKSLQVEMGFEGERVHQRVKGFRAGMLFKGEDDSGSVQIGPDMLSVHQLRPYSNWPTFKGRILQDLADYRAVSNPKGLRRIGVRYVNRVEIPSQKIDLDEFFRVGPRIPSEVPQDLAGFFLRTEIPHEEIPGVLVLVFGPAAAEQPGTLAFMLDLDFVSEGSGVPPLEIADSWIEQAHEAIERAFLACLTERCEALFKET